MYMYYYTISKKNCNVVSLTKIGSHNKSFRTARGTKCDFTAIVKGKIVDQCQTYTREGIALNVNECIDETVASTHE